MLLHCCIEVGIPLVLLISLFYCDLFFLNFFETFRLRDDRDVYSDTYTAYTHYTMLHCNSRPYEKNCEVNTILKRQKGKWHGRL